MRRGRHGRVGKRSTDWQDGQPPRSAERTDAIASEEADPTRRAPGRKDRRGHCNKLKGPHVWALTYPKWLAPEHRRCGWKVQWDTKERQPKVVWRCNHQIECVGCEKWKQYLPPDQCPARRDATEDERRALRAALGRWRARMAEREEKRAAAAPQGPQGYRRKRR